MPHVGLSAYLRSTSFKNTIHIQELVMKTVVGHAGDIFFILQSQNSVQSDVTSRLSGFFDTSWSFCRKSICPWLSFGLHSASVVLLAFLRGFSPILYSAEVCCQHSLRFRHWSKPSYLLLFRSVAAYHISQYAHQVPCGFPCSVGCRGLYSLYGASTYTSVL